jgi:hypothetical protein
MTDEQQNGIETITVVAMAAASEPAHRIVDSRFY